MDKEKKSIKLIETGAEIIGDLSGVAIGLIYGPFGQLFAGSAGIVIKSFLSQIVNQHLSSREQLRVGGSIGIIITGINDKIESGENLRNDGFFDAYTFNRSKASELLEGIVLKCKNEYEEKKIFYISNLYKNVAFDSILIQAMLINY